MFQNKSRLLIVLILLTFLPLATIAYTPSMTASNSVMTRLVPPLGTDSYSEDFSTTTYRDAGATDAEGWGNGTITNPRGYSIQILDYFSTPYPVRTLDVQGRKAYIALFRTSAGGSKILRILNITDPADITEMGTRDYPSYAHSLKVDGDTIYTGCDWDQCTYGDIFIYNASVPGATPSVLGSFFDQHFGNITDLAVQGHFLYAVYHGSNRSIIIDVEDPDNMNYIGYTTWNDLYGLDVDGQLAYLADGIYGLYIQNVSNPYAPTTAGSVNTPGSATDCLVDGSLVYVADGTSGVQIVDASNPSSPTIIGSYDTAGFARRLALQGHTLYVVDGANGLVILDVADPTNPIFVDRVNLPFTWDVDLYGGDVVVATNGGVYTLRIGAGLTSLPLIGTYDGYEVWDVRVQGDIAYVAAGPDGFLTLDLSDPANPVLLDRYAVNVHHYRKLDVQGHIAYVADYAPSAIGGFLTFDISDPTNIVYLDRLPFIMANDVYVAGEVAYVPFGAGGTCLVNVSNPYNIATAIITQWFVGSNTTSGWVQGYHLYTVEDLGGGGVGLRIYDITDISNPVQVEGRSRISYHYDIFVDGDIAYLADGYWITLYNVTNPSNPNLPDEIYNASQWWSMGVWGFGPYVLQASGHGGVQLINTTNINGIQILDHYSAASSALQVTVHGDYAYVANRSSLVILQLFRSAGATYTPGACQAVSVEVDTTDKIIENATLTYNAYIMPGTTISFEMSANGGTNWEAVTPGVEHNFVNTGSDLRWRATLNSPLDDRSVHLYSVDIDFEYSDITPTPTPPPIPGFPIEAIAVGALFAISYGLIRRRKRA